MDIKKVANFLYKDVKIKTTSNKIFVGRFIDFEEEEDVDVDMVLLQNKELWFNELQPIPVPDIQSIEEIK
ncbi:hypothetical protein [Pseudolactococcus insecticola]|uniref:Uncharacterized protein n=1 Tax=Pseudolactococcus insecticola TaxID=2709158 RepID=A0A6A0B8F0_9LACT|nr:hypothetical protein [Lactococcus insecticola]GFH40701.1 hypothetical protein Hs20B_10990 [Lactococcus insecticola]